MQHYSTDDVIKKVQKKVKILQVGYVHMKPVYL